MSPRRLAELAAAGAPAAQLAAAAQGNQDGYCQGARDPPPLDPAMRFVPERVELIQGEEEFWAEGILGEEQNNLEHAEHVNAVRARLAEEQLSYYLFTGSQATGLPVGSV